MSTVHLHRWTDIGAVEDFSDDEPVAVEAGGMQLAIFRLEDQLFALHDLCTHGVARLSEGYVEGGCVECPLHQGLFDIRTGAAKCAPVTEAVRSFPLRIHEGRVQVAVEADAAPATAKPTAVEVVLTSLDKVAPDVALVRMQLPAAHRFAYQPGQYIDILLGDQRRSYSLAQVTANALELHIRHLPGGLFTDQLFHQLAPGTPLSIDGPHGQFTLQATQKPKIMVATGTGFAPVKAMLEALIAAGNGVPVTLYWGGRTLPDLYQHSQCLDLATRYPWFHYVPVLSAATATSWQGRQGYVTDAVLQDWPDLQPFEVYACGSPAMVATANQRFVAQGLAPTAFFADAFYSQADRRQAA
ncbi:Rieske 2Fe-2S domain-containing protein [Methylophilus sp. 13]|uniref:anthranilate 1,2-dioxygenase ferredoxin subunit AndAb n=1 Tax=Methylophilus sp. 13 TaxID=2781018 RepID=UPI00188FF900|nr:anthranilate 1,2-dioxygenase ferredoxin subunit AndAb [Methylophilus sp. 13]MBF5040472.1 Rieske 2Fe-2S domain-containing protein [Methylophilus sp. 13]